VDAHGRARQAKGARHGEMMKCVVLVLSTGPVLEGGRVSPLTTGKLAQCQLPTSALASVNCEL
jgi:hypothetical protein